MSHSASQVVAHDLQTEMCVAGWSPRPAEQRSPVPDLPWPLGVRCRGRGIAVSFSSFLLFPLAPHIAARQGGMSLGI